MTIEDLALKILTGNFKKDGIEAAGWEYRKGKGVGDINHAIRKASKQGRGKFEYELNMFELYLAGVLKKKRKAPA
jgi:hypothetical protein